MRPAGSGCLPTLLFIFLNLVALSSYALPLHGTSAGTGSGRLKRHFRTSQPFRRTEAISSGSIHAHLHQRRKQAPIVASSRRTDGPMSHHVHLIDRAYLPANMTDVKHVILARRHRHKDYQTYEKEDEGDDGDSKSSKSRSGKDDKGYDDGSWSEDKYDEGEGDEETDTYSKKGKSKYKAASSDSGENDSGSKVDDEATTDISDSAESGDGETTEDPAPATKAKTVSKSTGNGTADEEDSSSDSQDSVTSDKDNVEEDDTVAEGSSMKNKSVKSSKEDDADEQAVSNEEKESTDSTSTKSARSEAAGDCATLKKVYDDMGGSAWKQNKGWSKSSDNGCCEAYGVTCNSDSQITALDLGSNGLKGTISPAIFDLKSLTRL